MLAALRSAASTASSDGDPEAIERTHMELVDAQIVALDLFGALETTRELERAAPETLRGRVQHASLSWALGRLDEGVAALQEVLAREPADIDARLLLGELQAALGDARAAKAAFSEAIDRAESPVQLAGAVAGWLVQRGEVAEAIELAERTTANAVDADTLAMASELERIVERPDRAMSFAERAEKAGATPGRVAILKAEATAAKAGKDDRAAAVKLLLTVPASAPEHVEARLRAAELLRDDGRFIEAERALAEASPGGAGAKRDAADALAQTIVIAQSQVDEKRGDAVRAARRLDEALAHDPNDARLLLSRAAVDERRGEWRRGLETAEKVIAREPRNVDALNFAGFTAADHDHDLPLATRRLQASVALSPGSGGIVDSLGWAYFRAGDLLHAAAFLEQANRLEPRDPEILGHLGDLYAKRGERERALEAYRRALGLKPSDRVARELTARLRALEAKSAAGR
jgi:tetratricopeptide (TPR) repeat protein